MGLTYKRVERANAPGRYADGGNLYLQVTATGAKSWLFRYQVGGRDRSMGLGPTHTVDLDEARELARHYRKLLLEGKDPLIEHRATREKNRAATATHRTFREAANEYFEAFKSKWSAEKVRQGFKNLMRDYAEPIIGDLAVSSIDDTHILRVLEQPVPAFKSYPSGPLWIARAKSARTLRRYIAAVLDFAKVHKYRRGDNPADWKVLKAALPVPNKREKKSTVHYPSMAHAEVAAFLKVLREKVTTRRAALEFIILCASRTSEVLGARWDEIDFDERVWTIPGSRMKTGVEHRVPLSTTALALLRKQPRALGNPFVFPGRGEGPLSDRTIAKLQRDLRPDATTHGYRSSFRVWASEKTKARHDVIEKCLSHLVGSEVERAYARSDLLDARRELMQAWADYCSVPASKILPMRARK